MEEPGKILGRLLWADSDRLIVGRGPDLLESRRDGLGWHRVSRLTTTRTDVSLRFLPLVGRLLRRGIHHVSLAECGFCAVVDGQVVVQRNRGERLQRHELVGSRPLALCAAEGAYYYGEYRANHERSPVSVWKYDGGSSDWRAVWTFKEVRHIHGVYFDSYTQSFWVTTGDEDDESAVWRSTDGFRSLSSIISGSQESRVVSLLFTDRHVYFGTDSPHRVNYLYRMDRTGDNLLRLQEVGGSVFYSCKVGDALFFSTAVEPSEANSSRYAEVWGSMDGLAWKKVMEFRKDLWPMKWFQYGQVLFPNGPGDSRNLYVTPFAAQGHGETLVLPLRDVFE